MDVPGRKAGSKNFALKPQSSTVRKSSSTTTVPWSEAAMSAPFLIDAEPSDGGGRGTSWGSSWASKVAPELRKPPTS